MMIIPQKVKLDLVGVVSLNALSSLRPSVFRKCFYGVYLLIVVRMTFASASDLGHIPIRSDF